MWKPYKIDFVKATLALIFSCLSSSVMPCAQTQISETIVVDATAPAHPLPHFWEHMFGSGRAILSLRDGYRQDLREVKQVTELTYVRVAFSSANSAKAVGTELVSKS